MAPAFGLSESKALIPRFLSVANKVRRGHRCPLTLLRQVVNYITTILPSHVQLVDKWKDVVVNEASGGSHTLDMWAWMDKATLDA